MPHEKQEFLHIAITEAKAEGEPNRVRDTFLGIPKAFVWQRRRGLHLPSIAWIRTTSAHGSARCQCRLLAVLRCGRNEERFILHRRVGSLWSARVITVERSQTTFHASHWQAPGRLAPKA
jgi:hypothetical protein